MKAKEPTANHCINVTQEVWEFWTEEARKKGISRTELLRQSVKCFSTKTGTPVVTLVPPEMSNVLSSGDSSPYTDRIGGPLTKAQFPKSKQLGKKS